MSTSDLQEYRRETKNHRMTILQDEGVCRRIRMAAPNTSSYAFQIVTFPGTLVVTGDMGSWVFSRLHDMFEFHRISWDKPHIDYDYWEEKCLASDRNRKRYQFDQEAFQSLIKDEFEMLDWEDSEENKEAVWDRVEQELIDPTFDTSSEALEAAANFHYDTEWTPKYPFEMLAMEGPFEKVSWSFRWVCWAIADTIAAYDSGCSRAEAHEKHYAAILKGKV